MAASESQPARTRIGLALSGGGVRGLVHLGVLRAFEEHGLPVDFLVGTSMGGLIAGAYGAGVPLDDIIAFAVKTKVLDFASPDRSWRALFDQRKLGPKLAELLGSSDITFEDLRIRAAVTAVDLETGDLVILDKGPLIPALLATAALPLFFAPVRHDGRWLVDGGVLNNVPFDVCRCYGADRVLAVTIAPLREFELEPGPGHHRSRGLSLGGLLRLGHEGHDWRLPFLIAEAGIGRTQELINSTRMELCPPDMVLEVALPGIGMLSTDGSEAAVEAGYRAAQERLGELQALAAPLPPPWRRRWRALRHRARLAWRVLRGPDHLLYPEPREVVD